MTILPTDNDIRKDFGQSIKQLHKQRNWPQKEPATKIDVRYPQLNKYECDLHTPPIEKLIKMAEVFDTTIDFLLIGDRSEQKPMRNLRLLEWFQALEEFDAEDQEAVIKLIDAMIVKNKVKGAISPFTQKGRLNRRRQG